MSLILEADKYIDGSVELVYSFTHEFAHIMNLLGFLKFFSAGHTFGLVLRTPQLGLSIRLGELTLDVSLALGFLLYLLAQVVQVMLQVAELAQESCTLLQTFRQWIL